MIWHVLTIIALIFAFLAIVSAGRAQRFWDQHQFRMFAYHELYEKYAITADYFKRRVDKRTGGKELDKDYRQRIEKLMALDTEAAAIRETGKKGGKP